MNNNEKRAIALQRSKLVGKAWMTYSQIANESNLSFQQIGRLFRENNCTDTTIKRHLRKEYDYLDSRRQLGLKY